MRTSRVAASALVSMPVHCLVVVWDNLYASLASKRTLEVDTESKALARHLLVATHKVAVRVARFATR